MEKFIENISNLISVYGNHIGNDLKNNENSSVLKDLELYFSKFPSNHSKLSGKRLLWQDMVHKIDLLLPKLEKVEEFQKTIVFQFSFLSFHCSY